MKLLLKSAKISSVWVNVVQNGKCFWSGPNSMISRNAKKILKKTKTSHLLFCLWISLLHSQANRSTTFCDLGASSFERCISCKWWKHLKNFVPTAKCCFPEPSLSEAKRIKDVQIRTAMSFGMCNHFQNIDSDHLMRWFTVWAVGWQQVSE